MGVEHALLPEQGLTAPGEAMIGADSHTCTYGAVNMFSTGVGSTDMAAGMATGLAWFRIPSAIKVTLKGKLQPCVSGKDVILHLIGTIGVDGALYKSLEFGGEGVASLSMDDRFTIANMAIEAGAKNGIFPVDDKTRAYLDGRVTRPWEAVEPDADAEYEREVVIDLDTLQPTVALPHLPSNTRTVDQVAGTHIDQVVIGSCTNGRLEDLRQAAAVLKGRKVAAGVRCIVIPATQQRHAGLEHVVPGQLVEGKLDLVLGNDITTPVAIAEFNKAGLTQVFDREKIALVLDHYTPCKDIKAAQLCAQVREFAKRFDITHFYDVGCMGVEHALLPEQGLTAPGEAMIGADSHTCTYGAVNMFSTGVGSTDMAAGMATGLAWFRIPSAIKVTLKGKLQPCVSGKDVILHLIGTIGVDGALYKSLEFGGEGVASLSMDDRFTIANMAIEAGAKNGIFPVDDKTRAYLDGRVTPTPMTWG